jgi:hypothetical protein
MRSYIFVPSCNYNLLAQTLNLQYSICFIAVIVGTYHRQSNVISINIFVQTGLLSLLAGIQFGIFLTVSSAVKRILVL